MSNNLLMKPKKSKKPSSKKPVQGLHSIIPPFVDEEEADQELLDSLMTNPDLLIMDEPSEGLAPRVIKQIGDVITGLKGKLTVFLAEQNFNMAISVADYVYIVSNGSIVYESSPEELRDNEEIKQSCLGV